MGFIDNIRRIIAEDFPKEDRQTVSKLAYVINTFMEQVSRQINGNIDFNNLSQDFINFTITVDASGVPVGNNIVKTSIINPRGLVVTRALNQDNSSVYPTNTPFISYSPNRNIIKINKITGLQANTEYRLFVIVIP